MPSVAALIPSAGGGPLSAESGFPLEVAEVSFGSERARAYAAAIRKASEAEARNVASAVATIFCGAHSSADPRIRCCCVTEKELLRLYTENCVLCRRIRALAPAIGQLQERVQLHEEQATLFQRISEQHKAAVSGPSCSEAESPSFEGFGEGRASQTWSANAAASAQLEAVERNKEELSRQKAANEERSRKLEEEVRILREAHDSLGRQQKLELQEQRLAFEEQMAQGRAKAEGICQAQQQMLERQREELEGLQKKHDSLFQILKAHEQTQLQQVHAFESREAICDRQGRDIRELLRDSQKLQLRGDRLEAKAAACEEALKAESQTLVLLKENQRQQERDSEALSAAQRASEEKLLHLERSHGERLLESSKQIGGLLTWRQEQSETQKDLVARQSSLQAKLDLIQKQQLKQMQLQEERQTKETQFRSRIQEEMARLEKRLAERSLAEGDKRIECPPRPRRLSLRPEAETAAAAAFRTANAATEAAVSLAEAASRGRLTWKEPSRRGTSSEIVTAAAHKDAAGALNLLRAPSGAAPEANRFVSAEYAASYASARARGRAPSVPEELLSEPREHRVRLTLTPSLEALHAQRRSSSGYPPAEASPRRRSLRRAESLGASQGGESSSPLFFEASPDADSPQPGRSDALQGVGASPDLLREMERQKQLLRRIEAQLSLLRGNTPESAPPPELARRTSPRRAKSASSDLIRRATLDTMLLKAKLQLALLEMETRRMHTRASQTKN